MDPNSGATSESMTLYLWREACIQAIRHVGPSKKADMTGADQDHSWRVLFAARAFYVAMREPRVISPARHPREAP